MKATNLLPFPFAIHDSLRSLRTRDPLGPHILTLRSQAFVREALPNHYNNDIVVVMAIPSVDPKGNLPKGIHDGTWRELSARFGSTEQRRALLDGLKRALLALQAAGCRRAYVDGSLVTSKVLPRDFDGCWDDSGIDLAKLDPVLLDFKNKRAAQKVKYLGEFFPANNIADATGRTFLEFFQADRNGQPKGIVRIKLGRLR